MTGGKTALAQDIIDRHVALSLAAGALPLPFADAVGIGMVQMRMISGLADLYETPFHSCQDKAMAVAVLGGLAPHFLAKTVAAPLAALHLGPLAVALVGNFVASPALAAASTWAVGWWFVEHFESGGTVTSIETARARRDIARATSLAVQSGPRNTGPFAPEV